MEYCVYLNWTGLTSTEWAAWAQAVLSGLAILFAGRFALEQHRRETAQRVGVITALLARVSDEAESLSEGVKAARDSLQPGQWTSESWVQWVEALRRIEVHTLPDDRLVHPILDATSAAQSNVEMLVAMIKHAHSSIPLAEAYVKATKATAARIGSAYADVAVVNRSFRPLSRRQKKHMKKEGITPSKV